MALVPFADIDALPPKAKDYWDKLTAKLNIFRMLANADTMMEPALRFGGAILSKQQLGADLRELVILLVAELEGGEYEWNQHVPIGLRNILAETFSWRGRGLEAAMLAVGVFFLLFGLRAVWAVYAPGAGLS